MNEPTPPDGQGGSGRRNIGHVTLSLTVLLVASCASLFLLGCERDRPKPIVDRSSDIEAMIRSELGTAIAEVHVELTPYEAETDFPISQTWRDWQYEGWYRLRGAKTRLAVATINMPDQIAGVRGNLRLEVEQAGGIDRLIGLTIAFEREFPEATEYSMTPYQWTFTGYECSNPQHMKTPRLVRNRYGEFDPDDVMFTYFGDYIEDYEPAALFAYDPTTSRWRRLPEESQAAFEQTLIHQGCDLSEHDSYMASEPTSSITTVVEY